MALDDRNKLNRLEEMKDKLFSRTYQTRIEHRDGYSRTHMPDVSDSWQAPKKTEPDTAEKFFMKTSRFKKFFIFSVIFFVASLGYASYIFFAGGNTVSNDNIEISILGNNFTAGGEELPLVIGVTNRNSTALDLVDLVIEYPKGSADSGISGASISGPAPDSYADTEHLRQSLGTIPAGAVRNENMKVVLFGQQGTTRTIKVSIEYRVAGSNAIFVKEKDYIVNINSTPINLSVDGPTTVSPNQNIALDIKTTLNATKPLSGILVKLSYPPGFTFVSSVPAPSFGNNVWDLGDLAPGALHEIQISGKMMGVFDGEEKTFNVSAGTRSTTDKSAIDVVFNSIGHTVSVNKPFIEATLVINGVEQSEYATNATTPISGEVRYTNNLDTKIDDVQIQAKITGNAFDRKTIRASQGFYDSAKDTITWDKSSDGKLAELNPGDSDSVNFFISPLALFSAAGILSNPSVTIDVSISGKQSDQGFATDQLENSSSAVVRIISDVGFSAKALYYSGPFPNTGPIPPKVGQKTTYTITWSLSNTANNISNVRVNATLPPWMASVGPISPPGQDLSYNASTHSVTWNVDRIPKGTGITSVPRTVSFQVSLTPSLSQAGSAPVIVNDAVLTGHDDFANVDVKVNKSSLTTNLDGDAAFPQTGGIVVN